MRWGVPIGRPSTAGKTQSPIVVPALNPGRVKTLACTRNGTPWIVVRYGDACSTAATASSGKLTRSTHRGVATTTAHVTAAGLRLVNARFRDGRHRARFRASA